MHKRSGKKIKVHPVHSAGDEPPKKRKDSVLLIEEVYGSFWLTRHQLDYIVRAVNDERHKTLGSTQDLLTDKIMKVTGWKVTGLRMLCRFAYKHGLAKL